MDDRPPRHGLGRDTRRNCREHGGFEPDIRHRTNDATVSLALVAQGLAVAFLPSLALPTEHPGITLRPTPIARRILAVTRTADAARPSIQALLTALEFAASVTLATSL